MKKRITPLFALIALLLLLPSGQAKEKATDLPLITEQTYKLDPMEVKTNPLANWGIGIFGRLSRWNKLTGGPAKGLYVIAVIASSPADASGVQLGDEIKSVNGVAASKLRFSDLEKCYYGTERGDTIKLELFNWVTKQPRTVELAITSNRLWMRKDDGDKLNCWGLYLHWPANLQGGVKLYPVTNRIAHRETVQVVRPHKPRKHQVEDVSKPVLIMRRVAIYHWAGKSLVLIERENRVVEIIEATKVPKSDDVVGRLVHEGSTLTLKPDGTYELKDVLPKAEPASMFPAAEKSPVEAEASAAPGVSAELLASPRLEAAPPSASSAQP